MNDKALKKLKRSELLELLLEQRRKNEQLEQELASLKEQLQDRNIRLGNSGSIAEASLALTNIFKEAQKAADIYLQSVKERSGAEEPVKIVEPVETVELVEPVESVESVEPVETVELVEPDETVEPFELIEPDELVEPDDDLEAVEIIDIDSEENFADDENSFRQAVAAISIAFDELNEKEEQTHKTRAKDRICQIKL